MKVVYMISAGSRKDLGVEFVQDFLKKNNLSQMFQYLYVSGLFNRDNATNFLIQ